MGLSKLIGKFIEKENLFPDSAKVLISVSGGMDSMALLHVLKELGIPLGVGHVNYRLRGKESNLDERLIEDYCIKYDLKYHLRTVTQSELEDLLKNNLQAKARQIRYDWLEQVYLKYGYTYICTAHHLDDNIETFFFRSIRGSGIKGLKSMLPKKGIYIKPFIRISKSDIKKYTIEKMVPFRTDLSNLTNQYDRNYIRNEILPLINDHFDNASRKLALTLHHIQSEYILFEHLIEREFKNWFKVNDKEMILTRLDQLKLIPGHESLLFHWMEKFDFNADQTLDMVRMPHTKGALFYSSSHRAIIQDDKIIVRKIVNDTSSPVKIEGSGVYNLSKGVNFSIQKMTNPIFSANPKIEFINTSNVHFPLFLRHWQTGDKFQPLGLKGHFKKLSDLFTDAGLNLFEKEEVWILCDKKNIIWVAGMRMDDRYKLNSSAKQAWRLEISENEVDK